MPVSAPADRRFRRAHVTPARKRSWRLTWWTLARIGALAVLVAFGMYRLVHVVLAADALRVSRITVHGNERMSRGEVLAILDGLRGRSMVTADLESWRQKLLNSPWVADAAIRRVLPGTLTVAISERRPMGIGRIRDVLYLVDQEGAIIDEYGPNYAELDLPIIDGLAAAPSAGSGTLVDETRAALAARVMADLHQRPDLAGRISQIDVSDQRDAVVILKGDTALVRVGEDRFAERIQSYVDLRPALRDRVPSIDYVDLRFDERVYVRPLNEKSKSSRGRANRTGG
ncbi:MAG TPA: FtsQ-type POTRA domain-containing protein [Vicinamibacterales bacterium]|jgi:cell division septal protein FtsQ